MGKKTRMEAFYDHAAGGVYALFGIMACLGIQQGLIHALVRLIDK